VDRQNKSEESTQAEREERPDKEKSSARVRDAAVDADAPAPHVQDGDGQRKKSEQEHDDVPRAPFGEHERSVQPHPEQWQSSEVSGRSRLKPTDDVVRQMQHEQDDAEQRRDDEFTVVLHFFWPFQWNMNL